MYLRGERNWVFFTSPTLAVSDCLCLLIPMALLILSAVDLCSPSSIRCVFRYGLSIVCEGAFQFDGELWPIVL